MALIDAWLDEFSHLRHFLAENNLVVLAPSLRPDCAAPAGATFGDMEWKATHPPIYRQVVARGNVVGQLDGSWESRAAGVASTQIASGIVQENSLRVTNAHPLWQWKGKSGAISYFENQGPAGNLVRGEDYDPASQSYESIEELRTRIEEALLLAL